ncbi:hypothetical protein [Streptomyces caatingaensis]|uniref:Membrane protein n=1 Tax=Streptomyces caatingaensis TaxID=1678637 RepID=A0A0K9XDI9_9ACTN|nr:hypothetical protein [Streptomyces caatingaensis]KNB51313.1 membrane protein [Streptomyces caatingaensis]
MSGPLTVPAIVALVALLVVRQMKPQKVASGSRRWWVVPAVLTFVALREPGLVDAGHRVASVGLLTAGVLLGIATGAAWAWTTRIWTDDSGAIWARGTKATGAVWAGGMVLRLGLMGIGLLIGVHQGAAGAMLTVAAMLLARSAVVLHRAGRGVPSYGVVAGG